MHNHSAPGEGEREKDCNLERERVHAREEEWRNFIRKTSRERRRRRRLRRTHVGSAWVRREDPAHKLRTRAEHAECYEEAVISKGCLA